MNGMMATQGTWLRTEKEKVEMVDKDACFLRLGEPSCGNDEGPRTKENVEKRPRGGPRG